MFSYYGAKTKIIKHYDVPVFSKIIEPFAGSARYAFEYWENDVVLYELFHKVFEVWKYLINATKQDILSLPDLEIGDDIRDFKYLSDGEKWLIGYQLQRGNARPGCIVNKRCNWNKDKIRIAKNIHRCNHWKIFKEDGIKADWNNATVFIDPPYMVQKHGYNCSKVDYNAIKEKVNNDRSQYIICGNSDDTWIDFEPLVEMRGTNKSHIECVSYKGVRENKNEKR